MSMKAVIGVIIVAILIGVVYVLFEKNFTGGALTNSQSSSAQELSKGGSTQVKVQEESSLINLPDPEPSPPAIDSSTDLLKEAQGLQMRDYSTYFEEFKNTISQ